MRMHLGLGACALFVAVVVVSCGSSAPVYDIGTGGAAGAANDAGSPDATDASIPDAAQPDADASEELDVPRAHLNVLFVGNSYTYVNDVPGILRSIASSASTGPLIDTDRVVAGGATLQSHINTGTAQARIAQGGWTHVVLQGQSYEPTGSDNSTFLSAAQELGELVNQAGAVPSWFVTWARAKGEFNPATAEVAAARMQDELTSAYAAAMNLVPGSALVCVGEAFRASLRDHPEIVLHQSDNSHATMAGSYLAAATFYVALTGSAVPAESAIPSGIDATSAAALRDEAKVGSNCSDVRPKGDVTLFGEPLWLDEAGMSSQSDFGTAAQTVTRHLYLWNTSTSISAGVSDGMTLAGPFTWTAGGYPGGVGLDPVRGKPYCTGTLAPGTQCALSVSYSGAATASGTLTLNLSDAYQSSLVQALEGTTTDRGQLAIRYPQPIGTHAGPVGGTTEFRLLVSNVGATLATSTASSLDPSSPFAWAGGSFPGGTGPADVAGVTYQHCSAQLAPGDTCVITLSFTPSTTSSHSSAFALEFWSAPTPTDPATRDVVYSRISAYATPGTP